MSILGSVRKKLIGKFGRVYESTPGGYWKQYGYDGPFSQTPQGKFFLNTDMAHIQQYVERLKPYVKNNDIIGMKHPITENQPDDPHFGEDPVFVVYTTKKKRKAVEDILEKENIKDITWTEDTPTVNPAFMNSSDSTTPHQYKQKRV